MKFAVMSGVKTMMTIVKWHNENKIFLYKKLNKNTKGYTERRREINEGVIETADNEPIGNLEYAGTPGVFPLESEGSRPAKKVENKYSDYKCFTI